MYWVLEKPNLGLVSYSFLGLDFLSLICYGFILL